MIKAEVLNLKDLLFIQNRLDLIETLWVRNAKHIMKFRYFVKISSWILESIFQKY